MKTIAIIAAMPQEQAPLLATLTDATHTQIAHLSLTEGKLGRHRVILALAGIGKVNAAIATTLVITHYRPDFVINTGSAGGLGAEIQIGDIVMANACVHHDVDVRAFDYEYGQLPQLPREFNASEKLLTTAAHVSAEFSACRIHQGLIASGDQFIDNKDKIKALRQHFPALLAVEMEAAAIAQTCHQFNTPHLIIRAISDHADQQAEQNFAEFIEQAGKRSAEFVQALLAVL